MKALTLWQPWASLCVLPQPCSCGAPIVWHHGVWCHRESFGFTNTCRTPGQLLNARPFKTVETRSWCAPKALIGQRIAIHAAKKRPRDVWPDFRRDAEYPAELAPFYDYERYVEITESSDGDSCRHRWAGPLGAVVGTAVLTDCIPMVGLDDSRTALAMIWRPNQHPIWTDVSDQLPFGVFAPGRWAWLLADAEPCDPYPAVGRQGIWNWEP